ncbi:MAG TPA: hypothetical protein VKG44_07620, partial [Candidatus Baltobacteraceae bacterium]|nr:hypothetical protein [Candidatus Baltobacteraceae bacterium]
AAFAAGTAAANAETTSAPVQVAIVDRAQSASSLYPEFKRAFSDVAPLTIWMENAVAEAALEGQGAPLHTN